MIPASVREDVNMNSSSSDGATTIRLFAAQSESTENMPVGEMKKKIHLQLGHGSLDSMCRTLSLEKSRSVKLICET